MHIPSDAYLIAFLPVRDLAATRDFYERDLGLPLVRDQGTCLIFGGPAGGHFGFCHRTDEAALPTDEQLILTVVTERVDDVYRRLRSVGVETEAAPTHHPDFEIYHFFARDPDGYRVEVQSFDRPLPPPATS